MRAVAQTWSATAADNHVRCTVNTAASSAEKGGMFAAHHARFAGIMKEHLTTILASLLPRAARD